MFVGPLYVLRIWGFGLNLSAVSGYFPHFSAVNGFRLLRNGYGYGNGRKFAQLTDIREKDAWLCGHQTPYNGPTCLTKEIKKDMNHKILCVKA